MYIVSKQSRTWEKKNKMLAKNNRRAAHWSADSAFSAVHRGLLRSGTDGNTGFILHCYRVHCQNETFSVDSSWWWRVIRRTKFDSASQGGIFLIPKTIKSHISSCEQSNNSDRSERLVNCHCRFEHQTTLNLITCANSWPEIFRGNDFNQNWL